MRRSRKIAIASLLGFLSSGWTEPIGSLVESANKLLRAGKVEEAIKQYNQARIDAPDSPLLHYNLGNALYRAQQFDQALAAWQHVGDSDPKAAHLATYNRGNALYRLAEASERAQPERALQLYAEALAHYRQVLRNDPNDQDAKFNYELARKKLEELRQRQEQPLQQPPFPQQAQPQPQDPSSPPEESGGSPSEDSAKAKPSGDEPTPASHEGSPAAPAEPSEESGEASSQEDSPAERAPNEEESSEAAGSKDAGPPSAPREPLAASSPRPEAGTPAAHQAAAQAILDAARAEELSPGEILRRLARGQVAEPLNDW